MRELRKNPKLEIFSNEGIWSHYTASLAEFVSTTWTVLDEKYPPLGGITDALAARHI